MIALGSKAGTLAALAGKVGSATILPQVAFRHADWQIRRSELLAAVGDELGGATPLIVRSSCLREDSHTSSNAGAFLSVADVVGAAALEGAIDEVFASYGTVAGGDEVLVQPYVRDVKLAGVAMTRDASSGSHYVIINYQEYGGTSGVTSGRAARLETHVSSKAAPVEFKSPIREILDLAHELEVLLAHDSLDIEFAIGRDGEVYLFQVRPLVVPPEALPLAEQVKLLEDVERNLTNGMRRHPYLHGKRTLYGVMPDWNPAEIIGIRPRPLARSLYRELVTDSIWSYQRNNYGYRNLRSFPLMVHFSGLPYIDVRVSLNSFIPADIDPELAERLADYYLERLLAAPMLHDKVEFEIVFSCYTFELADRLEALADYGFTSRDVSMLLESLRKLTNNVLSADGLWRVDQNKLKTLTERHRIVMDSELDDVGRMYWLLEDCKRYGTLPFAGLARAAFIATQLLRSLVAVGVLTEAEHDQFLRSVDAVGSQITADFARDDKGAFLQKYGHLRPGTYDILSPRYDETPDLYFDWDMPRGSVPEHPQVQLSAAQVRAVAGLLVDHGFTCSVEDLFTYILGAIEWRELSKFYFTRNVSDILSTLVQFGDSLGFSRDDLSYASIGVVPHLVASSARARDVLAESIAAGRALHRRTLALTLPPLISDASDAWGFFVPPTEPNFVTKGRVTARPVSHTAKGELRGGIAFIESADPGFDWIFTHGIAGLITAYGGINSHMAVRAGELGIPAVIGAGDHLFKRWSAAGMLRVDCADRRVDILR